jgi:hypothetical protein
VSNTNDGGNGLALKQPPHDGAAEVSQSRTALAFPLSIDDQRPDWEKHSQDYRVEFVALEECIDPCWNLLADALQRETSRWPEPPCRATLELRSFRVVNKPEAAENQWCGAASC